MNAKVLVVDDVALNVKLLVDLLAAKGYRTCSATSGVEALAVLAAERPDLVLLDVMMPGMSGYDVCRAIRADPAQAMLPIVLVTALDPAEERGDEHDRQHRLRRIGADGATHVVAAHAGHHDVEQDQVGPLGGEHGERLDARGRAAGAIALCREPVDEQLDVERDVVDDEDLGVHPLTSLSFPARGSDSRCRGTA